MCRPSKIDGRCEIRLLYLLKILIIYISCMRITPRVCTSVLSLLLLRRLYGAPGAVFIYTQDSSGRYFVGRLFEGGIYLRAVSISENTVL